MTLIRSVLIQGKGSFSEEISTFYFRSPSMYLQCAPLYGRLGRWTERYCPDTLIFIVSIGRCEKGEETRKPYDPDNRVVIPRLPSETSFVEWKGNRLVFDRSYLNFINNWKTRSSSSN